MPRSPGARPVNLKDGGALPATAGWVRGMALPLPDAT